MANEDMSDMMKKLSSVLNSDTIPDNMKEILNNMKSNNKESTSSDNTSSQSSISPEMIQTFASMFNNSSKEKEDTQHSSNNSSISPEMINAFANMLNNSNKENSNDTSNNVNENDAPAIDFEMMMKMKTIIEKMNSNKDDPRANLLRSLKPYLKESRKDKVEQYVKLFNMSKVMDVFNPSGGEKKK